MVLKRARGQALRYAVVELARDDPEPRWLERSKFTHGSSGIDALARRDKPQPRTHLGPVPLGWTRVGKKARLS